MPNWCYNHIEIKGEPNDIKKISNIIENLKKEKNDILFQSLIGLPEGADIEKYKDDWYDINVNWFGTKWDVGLEFVQEIEKDYILFAGYTAWSPPVNFCMELSKLYNIQVEMYFEEPGWDFCGKCWIDSEGGYSEEVYGYHEGIYRFEGFQDWYEREWELMSDWMVDEFNEEDTPDLQSTIREKIPFLNDEEVEELSIEFKNLVETSTVSL
jgi:hypothetical protein